MNDSVINVINAPNSCLTNNIKRISIKSIILKNFVYRKEKNKNEAENLFKTLLVMMMLLTMLTSTALAFTKTLTCRLYGTEGDDDSDSYYRVYPVALNSGISVYVSLKLDLTIPAHTSATQCYDYIKIKGVRSNYSTFILIDKLSPWSTAQTAGNYSDESATFHYSVSKSVVPSSTCNYYICYQSQGRGLTHDFTVKITQ